MYPLWLWRRQLAQASNWLAWDSLLLPVGLCLLVMNKQPLATGELPGVVVASLHEVCVCVCVCCQ